MKRTLLLFLTFLSWAWALPAQEIRPGYGGQSAIRAVVVGISDYQNIPDLQFANRDAEAFAGWLQSEAGGNIPAENIQLLLDTTATLGEVAMALDWLMTASNEGDRAIIYFSGHGDVEKKMFGQPGYLLCSDAPAAVYMSGGTLSVGALQEVVATLTIVKKAQVFLITDACRAGALAGASIGGPQLTTAALQERFSNTVRIMSCQSNEYSVESRQWGGGRGAFSYFLVEGLYGLADQDADMVIKLKELGRYLEDNVPRETDPQVQNPLVLGDREARLAVVSEPLLATRKAMRAGTQPGFYSGDMRSLLPDEADSTVREVYASFLTAVAAGHLMDAPEGARSANECYTILIRDTSIANLHGYIKRHFVAALVDESQVVTNKLLVTDPQAMSDIIFRPFSFDHISAYLGRAVDILGERHFLYRSLKAKQFYFEGLTTTPDKYPGLSPDTLYRNFLGNMETALSYDSNAAYVLFSLAWEHLWRYPDKTKCTIYSKKLLDLCPNWVLSHIAAGYNYSQFDQNDQAIEEFLKTLEIDSTYYGAYVGLFALYNSIGETALSDEYANKCVRLLRRFIQEHSDQVPLHHWWSLGISLFYLEDFPEAAEVFERCAKLTDYKDYSAFQFLGAIYHETGDLANAQLAAQKQIELAPHNPQGYMQSGMTSIVLGEPEKAINLLEPYLSHLERLEDSTMGSPWNYSPLEYVLGVAYRKTGQYGKADTCFRKSTAYRVLSDNFHYTQFVVLAYYERGVLMQMQSREGEAEAQFRQILELVPTIDNPMKMNFVGRAYLGLGDLKSMQQTIEFGLSQFPDDPESFYQAACLNSLAHEENTALEFLDLALGKGFRSRTYLREDFDLDNIRDTKGFKALMEKHFPEKKE